ncbi:MAG: YceD family protein, partial [Bosea sp. (in: a-proteobacteria)]
AIARAHGCIAVEKLVADLKINRRGDQLRVMGTLKADVVQPCVVTLEPVPAKIREEVSFAFAPPVTTREAREEEAEDVAYEGEDPPEPLIEGEADLGAVLLQFFALALDPYPRKPDAELPAVETSDITHPFAALKGLKRDA